MQDPIETAEFLAFAKTVETHSLSRAAAELGVPRATISRRLARLEGRLGARLLRRTTRSLMLTDAGEALYRHARIVLDAVTQAESCVNQSEQTVRGELRVSAPLITSDAFADMLANFAKRYPEVRLHVQLSSQHVDLRRGGYDVALRATSALEPGLVARTLARTELVAAAAPAYLREHGVPKSARDLKAHRCLLGFARGELPDTHWPLLRGGKIALEGALFCNEMPMLREMALRGLGIGLLPMMLIQPDLKEGSLVRVLSGEVGAEARRERAAAQRTIRSTDARAYVGKEAAGRLR